MKPSVNTLEALNDISSVRTTGDIRRIAAQALLALVRKEISATDATAAAQLVGAVSASLAVEVKMHKVAADMRAAGGNITKLTSIGNAVIGTPDKD